MKKATRKTKRKGVVLNLDAIDPQGRVDVLIARVADRVVRHRYPALVPLFDRLKPTVHRKLNRLCGPQALPFDLTAVMKQLGGEL